MTTGQTILLAGLAATIVTVAVLRMDSSKTTNKAMCQAIAAAGADPARQSTITCQP